MCKKIGYTGLLLVFVFLAFLFSSCGSAAASQAGSAAAGGTAQQDASEQAEIHLLMLASNSANLVNGTGGADGFYYVQPRPDNILTGNLRYIDYATGQDVALSAQINSDHSDPSDPSYLDSVVGEYGVFLWQNQLYYLQSGASGYESGELKEKALGALYRMEPDGSGRTQIYQTDAGSTLLGDVAGNEQGELYLLEQTTSGVDLVQLDTKKQKSIVLSSFGFGTRLLGTAGSQLYLTCVDPGTQQGASYQVVSYAPETNQTKEVLSWTDSTSGTPLLSEDTIYFFPYDQPAAQLYSLEGEAKGSIDLSSELSGRNVYEQIYQVGDFIFLPIYDGSTKEYGAIIISTRDQSTQVSWSKFHDEEKNEDYSAVVMAETGDSLLVLTQRTFEEATMPQGDGTSITVSFPRYGFSLMSKQDYLSARIEDVQKIQMRS